MFSSDDVLCSVRVMCYVQSGYVLCSIRVMSYIMFG